MNEQIVGFDVLFVDGALQLVADTSEGNTYRLGKISLEEGGTKKIKRTGKLSSLDGYTIQEWSDADE